MSSRWIALIAAVALVVIAVLAWRDRASQRRLGGALATVARLRADSVLWAGERTRVDSVYVRDTLTYTRVRTEYQRLRDSVLVRTTDTLMVERFIAASDSTVRACQAVVTSCEARVAARDSLLRVVGGQRQADQRLFSARLRAANPRLLPYVEAGVDPLHQWAATGRAGLEVRFLGPTRLVGALQYSQAPTTHLSAAVGVRLTF